MPDQEEEFCEIAPTTHLLESIRADRGNNYSGLLSEAIDNSLDAGAMHIQIRLTGKGASRTIEIDDNGCGITRNREKDIVQLGAHGEMSTTALGRFGVGITYHAVSAGDVLNVRSTSIDGRMELTADWASILRVGKWKIDKPTWKLQGREHGTNIVIRALRWRSPTQAEELKIADILAERFYPALAEGKQILFNQQSVPILQEPALTHVIDGFVLLPNGKGAHVRGGILVHREWPLYQVQVSYKHRVIMPKSTFGCGTYGGLRGMFARVELTGPWGLARFKDKLNDDDANELEERTIELLRPILEQCHGENLEMRLTGMEDRLNAMLPPDMTPARPPQMKTSEEPKQEKRPARQGGITKTGTPTPRGPAKKPNESKKLKIEFDSPLVVEHGYGHFTEGNPDRIVLAKDNPHIAALLNNRDEELASLSLFALAIMIYGHAMYKLQREPGLYEKFGFDVWELVKHQKAM
jgi:hypothetical protein